MNTYRSVLLAVSLSLTACADVPVGNSSRDGSVANAKLTVHIIEAANPG